MEKIKTLVYDGITYDDYYITYEGIIIKKKTNKPLKLNTSKYSKLGFTMVTGNDKKRKTVSIDRAIKENFYYEKLKEELDSISLNGELWKKFYIDDMPNAEYYVSTKGRVYNYATNNILNLHKNETGYMRFRISESRENSRSVFIHRAVAILFIKNDNPEKIQVNHIDGNKENNCVDNLEWCTASENNQHAHDNNLRSNITEIKLDIDLANKIREEYSIGNTSVIKLAEKYGVSRSCIQSVLNNRSWKN